MVPVVALNLEVPAVVRGLPGPAAETASLATPGGILAGWGALGVKSGHRPGWVVVNCTCDDHEGLGAPSPSYHNQRSDVACP